MLTLILTLTLQGSLTLTLTLTLTLQGSRIVGFEVEPSSIRHTYSGAWKGGDTSLSTCGGSTGSSPLAMDSAGEVVFTYDVKWEYSEIKRAPVSGGGLQPAASAACGLCSLWPAACSSPWPPLPGPDSYPHPAPPRRPPCR